jgi:CheY-like chemotaxis protein
MSPESLQQSATGPGFRTQPFHAPRPESRAWSVSVLVVEDDLADTSLILDVLRRHPNVAAAHATDAPDLALRQLAAGQLHPDLVLLDIRMPRLDGFEFLDRLRQIPEMFETPVVFLTTSALASDVIEAKHSSACSYIVKPETYDELKARLDKVITRVVSGGSR